MKQEDRWQKHLGALRNYTKREKSSRVPMRHIEPFEGENIRLGSWVNYLRFRYRQGALSPERAYALEKLPGWEWGPFTPGPSTDKIRNAKIRDMRYNKKMTLEAIGDAFGLTRQRIHQILKKESK